MARRRLGLGGVALFLSLAAVARGEEYRLPDLSEIPGLGLASRLTVEEAYAAIPHRRTAFRFEQSPIPEPDRSYLRLMLELVDRGVVARVSAYRSFYYGESNREPLLRAISELARFAEVEVVPPPGLEVYHGEIVSALRAQEAFFTEWLREDTRFRSRDPKLLSRHPLVLESSRALRAAYSVLMNRYGAGEGAENRNAFFDYHCALDFI